MTMCAAAAARVASPAGHIRGMGCWIGELIQGCPHPSLPEIDQEAVEERWVGRVDVIELRLTRPLKDCLNVFGEELPALLRSGLGHAQNGSCPSPTYLLPQNGGPDGQDSPS
jgi:hypothetical protein